MFDRDGNGKISASELSHAFRMQGQNIPDAEIRNIIKEVDVDGESVSSVSICVSASVCQSVSVCICILFVRLCPSVSLCPYVSVF